MKEDCLAPFMPNISLTYIKDNLTYKVRSAVRKTFSQNAVSYS